MERVGLGHKKARRFRPGWICGVLVFDAYLADRLSAMDARLFVAVMRQNQCQPICANGDHHAVILVGAENVRIRRPVSRSAIGGDGDGQEELCKFFPSEKLGDAEKVGDIVGDSDGDVHFVMDSRVKVKRVAFYGLSAA